jgi:hypothetical protein
MTIYVGKTLKCRETQCACFDVKTHSAEFLEGGDVRDEPVPRPATGGDEDQFARREPSSLRD